MVANSDDLLQVEVAETVGLVIRMLIMGILQICKVVVMNNLVQPNKLQDKIIKASKLSEDKESDLDDENAFLFKK